MIRSFVRGLSLIALPLFVSSVAAAPITRPTEETRIISHRILRTRLMSPVDRQGFPYYMGVVEGKVEFVGTGPVFVTLSNGNGRYSAPVDRLGNYTFLTEVTARDVIVDAWIPGVPSPRPNPPSLVTRTSARSRFEDFR